MLRVSGTGFQTNYQNKAASRVSFGNTESEIAELVAEQTAKVLKLQAERAAHNAERIAKGGFDQRKFKPGDVYVRGEHLVGNHSGNGVTKMVDGKPVAQTITGQVSFLNPTTLIGSLRQPQKPKTGATSFLSLTSGEGRVFSSSQLPPEKAERVRALNTLKIIDATKSPEIEVPADRETVLERLRERSKKTTESQVSAAAE